jgi:signal transduction histidine kinase
MTTFAADYHAALSLHDEDGLDAHLQKALQLGTTAVRMGVDTLELAKIHEAALTTILSSPAKAMNVDATTNRATIFFNEALTPIEKTHRSALEAAEELHETNTDLSQRNKDLVVSKRKIAQEKEERKLAENALRTSEEKGSDLLVESQLLEAELLEMVRRTLSANEAERKQMCSRLQDDIAQEMLGIHVRLLALKAAVKINQEDVTTQISTTERLMAQSVKTISSFAKAMDRHHEN